MGMDFLKVKEEAGKYISDSNLAITHYDEKNLQVHISSQDGVHSFYISCPSQDIPSWGVWSEKDESLELLQTSMEMLKLDSCSCVSEALKSIDTMLKTCIDGERPDSKKAEDDDDDEEEEEEEDEEEEEEDSDTNNEEDEYYMQDDIDAVHNEGVSKERESEMEVAANFFNSKGSSTAISRLVKDLKAIQTISHQFGISGQPRGNNLFMWNVELSNIPTDTKLGKDLKEYQMKYKEKAAIKLDVQFPSEYPFQPPFIRVLKPRFKFLTGHITVGGSICMQALTKSGWCPANDLESILIQVRTEILSDPAACLDPHHPNKEYGEGEARDAFSRMVKKYGWS